MAVIIYSVSGEGMGHATRSEVVIRHLISKGNEIIILSYDRAYSYMKKRFSKDKRIREIIEIVGINLIYEENELKLKETVMRESKKLKELLFKDIYMITDIILKHSPSIIVTDFEPMAGTVAKLLNIPLVCIDNIGILSKCELDKNASRPSQTRMFRYMKFFDGDYNFITSFFPFKIREKLRARTKAIGPLLRKEILNASPTRGDHILVYQTTTSNEKLFDTLKETDQKYIIYGFNISKRDNGLVFKKSSIRGFVNDLKTCKAVITNGGFTLVSEALYLKKPVYSVPVQKQVEQMINGYYIEKMHYGIFSKEINNYDLQRFLDGIERFSKNLQASKIVPADLDLISKKIEDLSSGYAVPKRSLMLKKIKEKYDSFAGHLIVMKKETAISKLKKKAKKHIRSIKKRFRKKNSKK